MKLTAVPKMEPPQTTEDHAQLFLNLYRMGHTDNTPAWKYIEAWAEGVLRRPNGTANP